MPKVKANHKTMNYDQQGTGEPLITLQIFHAREELQGSVDGSRPSR